MPSEQADEFSPEALREQRLKGKIRLGYIALAFWPFLLFASFMGFDSPNAANRAAPWVVLVCSLCFGGLPFVTHVAARLTSGAGRYKAANWIGALPMTLMVALFGLVIAWAIAMDIVLRLHIWLGS